MSAQQKSISSLNEKSLHNAGSVSTLNSQELIAIHNKQEKLQGMVSQLARMTGMQLYEYSTAMNTNPNKNVYLLNQRMEKVNSNPINNSVKQLNSNIVSLTHEIYGDILNLRNLDHKYDTLSSNEQQHLDKMIDEYTKKYKEISNLDESNDMGLLNQQVMDTQLRMRYQSSMYIAATIGSLVILGGAIYLFKKK
jgi:hypothetical protein